MVFFQLLKYWLKKSFEQKRISIFGPFQNSKILQTCSGISTAALLHTITYKVLFPPQINWEKLQPKLCLCRCRDRRHQWFSKACDNIRGLEPRLQVRQGQSRTPGCRALPRTLLTSLPAPSHAAGHCWRRSCSWGASQFPNWARSHGPGGTDRSWEAWLQPAHQPGRKARRGAAGQGCVRSRRLAAQTQVTAPANLG